MSEETQAEPLPPGDQEIDLRPAAERLGAEKDPTLGAPQRISDSTSRLAVWTPEMDEPEPPAGQTSFGDFRQRMAAAASARVPKPMVSQNREPCEHCGGRGFMPSVSDYLRESIQLLGDQGDEVVRAFYVALFRAAPETAKLFPGDPTQGELGTDHRGARQRELLLSALASLADLYDPDDPDKMKRLDTALGSFGRKHAAFARPDGTVKGATWEEYGAVKDALFQTLVRAAGEKWRPEYAEAWSQAYDYAAAVMVAEQYRSGFSAPRFPRV